MRLAFELCFTNAAIFASRPMRFLSLDEITFRLPVPIGAVLRLTSKVVHTSRPEGPDDEAKAHIMVRAEVEEVETGVSPIRLSRCHTDCVATPRDQHILLHHGRRGRSPDRPDRCPDDVR